MFSFSFNFLGSVWRMNLSVEYNFCLFFFYSCVFIHLLQLNARTRLHNKWPTTFLFCFFFFFLKKTKCINTNTKNKRKKKYKNIKSELHKTSFQDVENHPQQAIGYCYTNNKSNWMHKPFVDLVSFVFYTLRIIVSHLVGFYAFFCFFFRFQIKNETV